VDWQPADPNADLDFNQASAYLLRIDAPVPLPGWIAGPIGFAIGLLNIGLTVTAWIDGNTLWIDIRRPG